MFEGVKVHRMDLGIGVSFGRLTRETRSEYSRVSRYIPFDNSITLPRRRKLDLGS